MLRRKQATREPDASANFQTWLGLMVALVVTMYVCFVWVDTPHQSKRFDLFSIVWD